ncbi:hypothetical protein MIR68_003785 [Amoeboaphelidium protococcarum]|nr:hypothetical protein MIR68_003785 [Amoeboaphelidium protococcarum]
MSPPSSRELKHQSISGPIRVEQKVHVDRDFNWSASDDPNKVFELQSKLGEGAFGSVHKAAYRMTGFIMAIKVIQVGKNAASITKEVDLLKKVNHKNAVRYYGSCVSGDFVWILMDYCGNGSVHDLLEFTIIPEKSLQWIVGSALEGLVYLHQLQIIHRDIKSANILLTDDCEVKIADFGVSDHVAQTIMARNTVVGTPFFMAPEIITASNYNVLADIWSLGITVMEMGEGCPPLAREYPNPMRAMFKIPFLPPPTLHEPERWSKKMADFLSLCLVKDFAKRSSALDLLTHPWLNNFGKQKKSLQELVVEVKKEKVKQQELALQMKNAKTVVAPKHVLLLQEYAPTASSDGAQQTGAGTFIVNQTTVQDKNQAAGTFIQHDVAQDTVIFTGGNKKPGDQSALSKDTSKANSAASLLKTFVIKEEESVEGAKGGNNYSSQTMVVHEEVEEEEQDGDENGNSVAQLPAASTEQQDQSNKKSLFGRLRKTFSGGVNAGSDKGERKRKIEDLHSVEQMANIAKSSPLRKSGEALSTSAQVHPSGSGDAELRSGKKGVKRSKEDLSQAKPVEVSNKQEEKRKYSTIERFRNAVPLPQKVNTHLVYLGIILLLLLVIYYYRSKVATYELKIDKLVKTTTGNHNPRQKTAFCSLFC